MGSPDDRASIARLGGERADAVVPEAHERGLRARRDLVHARLVELVGRHSRAAVVLGNVVDRHAETLEDRAPDALAENLRHPDDTNRRTP